MRIQIHDARLLLGMCLAIDNCAGRGGGVVCLPPGRHVSGPLWLKNNKVFSITVQDGATVSGVPFVNVTFETNWRHWNWWGSAEVMKFVLKKRTPKSRLGRIRDVTIDGAQGTARGTSLVAGHPECKLENITITLKNAIQVRTPYLTLAGQTSPGGVQI